MKKKNKNNNIGLKIGGVVIVLVLLIKWGNTFFQAKDTFTPKPKQQSQSTPKKKSQSTPQIVNLSCVFQNAYDEDGKINPGSEAYTVLSGDFSIYLDYEYKKMGSFSGWTTTVWNENEITAEFNQDLSKGFYMNNTFTLNRNTGKLSRVMTGNLGNLAYLNYKCSKASKKF